MSKLQKKKNKIKTHQYNVKNLLVSFRLLVQKMALRIKLERMVQRCEFMASCILIKNKSQNHLVSMWNIKVQMMIYGG